MGVKKVEKVLELLEVVRRYKYDLLSYWYKPISRSVWRACCLVTIWNLTISLDSLLLDGFVWTDNNQKRFLKTRANVLSFRVASVPSLMPSLRLGCEFLSTRASCLPCRRTITGRTTGHRSSFSVFNCRGRLTAASLAPSCIGVSFVCLRDPLAFVGVGIIFWCCGFFCSSKHTLFQLDVCLA